MYFRSTTGRSAGFIKCFGLEKQFFVVCTFIHPGIKIVQRPTLQPSLQIPDSWLRLLDKRKSRQRKRYSLLTRISTYAAVAMFAAAITSTVFIFSSREYDDRITSYVGGDGLEADVVVLPDGTRVSLGTRTSFSYDSRYGKSERIVQLEGEAYFEVAKDKDKPFIVKTKEQSIEALGTKFNVSAYPTDSLLTTTLLEGSVLLTTQNLLHPMVLKPNEQFVYNKRTRSALLQQVDANRYRIASRLCSGK